MSNGVGSNGTDPLNQPWNELTCDQRAVKIFAWIAALTAAVGITLCVLYAIGEFVGGISRHNSEHRRCLQQATNGLAIKECH